MPVRAMGQPSQQHLHQLLRFFNLPLDCRCQRTVRLRYLALAKKKHPDQQPASAAAVASAEFASLQDKYEQLCELLSRRENHSEGTLHSGGFKQPHSQHVWRDRWCGEQWQWAQNRDRWGPSASWRRVDDEEWVGRREKHGRVHYSHSHHQQRDGPAFASALKGAGVAGIALSLAFLLGIRQDGKNGQTPAEWRQQHQHLQVARSKLQTKAFIRRQEKQRHLHTIRQQRGKNTGHFQGGDIFSGIPHRGTMSGSLMTHNFLDSDNSSDSEKFPHGAWNVGTEAKVEGLESISPTSCVACHEAALNPGDIEQKHGSDANPLCACRGSVGKRSRFPLDLEGPEGIVRTLDDTSTVPLHPSTGVCLQKKHPGNIYGGDKFYERRVSAASCRCIFAKLGKIGASLNVLMCVFFAPQYIRRPVRLKRTRSASAVGDGMATMQQISGVEMDHGFFRAEPASTYIARGNKGGPTHLPLKLGVDEATLEKLLTVEAPLAEAASAYLTPDSLFT